MWVVAALIGQWDYSKIGDLDLRYANTHAASFLLFHTLSANFCRGGYSNVWVRLCLVNTARRRTSLLPCFRIEDRPGHRCGLSGHRVLHRVILRQSMNTSKDEGFSAVTKPKRDALFFHILATRGRCEYPQISTCMCFQQEDSDYADAFPRSFE